MDEKPLIDWFLVTAQVINFLILVAALKYFLYGRVLSAMEERQRKITDKLEQADRKAAEAETEKQEYLDRVDELNKERETLLALARQEADQEKTRLLQKNRHEVDQQRERWFEAFQQESRVFLDDLRRRIAEGALHLTRNMLTDMADEDLESRLVDVFLRRLSEMSAEQRQGLLSVSPAANGKLLVQSAFPLPERQQTRLQKTLSELLPGNRMIDFETSDAVLCGLRLTTSDRHVLWEMGRRLDEVVEEIRSTLAASLPENQLTRERR